MPIPGIRFGTTRQEGDDTFVTFFLVFLIAIIVVASFVMAPKNEDNMISMVPRSAILYAHANGEAISRLGPLMPATVAGLAPDEVGIFAVQSSGKDELAWGYLLSWRGENPDELSARYSILADLPRRNRDSVFVLADDAALRGMDLVELGGSLAEDASVTESLKQARSFSKNQMYVQPAGAQALFASDGMRPEEPQIVLWRNSNRLVFSSINGVEPPIAQLSRLSNQEAFSGPDWANLSVFGDVHEAKLILVNLLLGPDWSNDGAIAAMSGNRLMEILDDADYLATGSLIDKKPKFLVHINESDNQAAKSAFLDYFATKKPIMRDISMPDGEKIREMALDSSWLSFVARGEGYEVLSGSEEDIEIPSYTIFSDTGDGFWLADSPERIQSKPNLNNHDIKKFCLREPSQELKSWFLGEWIVGREMCVEEIVDKSVVIYSNY